MWSKTFCHSTIVKIKNKKTRNIECCVRLMFMCVCDPPIPIGWWMRIQLQTIFWLYSLWFFPILSFYTIYIVLKLQKLPWLKQQHRNSNCNKRHVLAMNKLHNGGLISCYIAKDSSLVSKPPVNHYTFRCRHSLSAIVRELISSFRPIQHENEDECLPAMGLNMCSGSASFAYIQCYM